MSKFLDEVLKIAGQDMARVAEDGTIADNTTYVDTGSFTLNFALSGSLFLGAPMNKVVGFAAEEAVGKSFLVIQIVKTFLALNPKGIVVYNDSEGRIDRDMLAKRGVDTSRVVMCWPETIEEFRNKNYQYIQKYRSLPAKDRVPVLMVCDSLTQFPSVKQLNDVEADKDAGDMGLRAKVWRSAWQSLRQPLAKAQIPMFCTNHTYKSTGMFPSTEVAGGGGFKYAADIILLIGKKKDTDEEDKKKIVRGNILHLKVNKGWNVKQHSEFRTYLNYSSGLDKYFGLQDLALEGGIFKKVKGGFEFPDGTVVLERDLLMTPQPFYTKEILEQIEAFAKSRYCFSDSTEQESLDELIQNTEE